MRDGGLVDKAADPTLLATVILAAIQGGLVLSQPERSAWPLEAALDSALAPLHGSVGDSRQPIRVTGSSTVPPR